MHLNATKAIVFLLISSLTACTTCHNTTSPKIRDDKASQENADETGQWLVALPFIAVLVIVTAPISIPLQNLVVNPKEKKALLLFQAQISIKITSPKDATREIDKLIHEIRSDDFATRLSISATGFPNRVSVSAFSQYNSQFTVGLGTASKPDVLAAISAFKRLIRLYSRNQDIQSTFSDHSISGPGFLGFTTILKAEQGAAANP